MRKIRNYVNTMYRPAFLLLCFGLLLFSIALINTALHLHADILAGKSDMIYRYPSYIAEIIMPLFALLPTTFIVDLNERRKNKNK